MHCENIRPDLSQVRLYVPEQYRWFDFGGTMRPVAAEADLQAGFVKFQTRETQQIVATLRQGDKFAKLRAAVNLKSQQAAMDQYRATIASDYSNADLQSELRFNTTVAQQAQEESKRSEGLAQRTAELDNRQQLGRLFNGQSNSRARNVVKDLGANWSETAEMKPASAAGQPQGFDREWLGQNKLDVAARQPSEKPEAKRIARIGPPSTFSADLDIPFSPGKPPVIGFGGRTKTAPANMPQQPSAAQVVQSATGLAIPQFGGFDPAAARNLSRQGEDSVRAVQGTAGRTEGGGGTIVILQQAGAMGHGRAS